MKRIRRDILVSCSFSICIFLFSILINLTFSYMGVTDKQITILIVNNFFRFLIIYNLKILLIYLIIGFILGVLANLLKIERKRGIILFSVFCWGVFWFRAVKIYPQLFLSQLYTQATLLKYLQVFITDILPLSFIYILFILVILGIGIRKKSIWGSTAVFLLGFLLIFRFDVSPQKQKSISAPNILIFATDSLRPQNISYHGYSRKTPNIDRFLANGVSFLNAKASIARTFPLWTSVLTSLYPPNHGIRTMYPCQKDLVKKWETLTDVLNRRHYFTSVVSDFAGDMFSRINYGFQRVDVPKFVIKSLIKQRCLEIHYFLLGYLVNPVGTKLFPEMSGLPMFLDPYFVTQKTKREIRNAVNSNRPFFIISFSSNNHFPYVSPFPYYRIYAEKKYFRKHKYCLGSDMMRSFLGERLEKIDQQQIVSLYDGATRLFDDNLGEILKFLKESNLEKDTIVIIMSDHGENLCELDLGSGHGDHLRGGYANNMLLGIYSPFEDFKGRKITPTIRDIDIAPTILNMLGIEIPAAFEGESLLQAMRGEAFNGFPVYMETGLWYTRWAPFIPNRVRKDYPMMKDMLTLNLHSGEIILKDEYAQTVINAKYRGLQLNEKKYLYMPGKDHIQEEYIIDDVMQKKETIRDESFLLFKQKILQIFDGRFFLDANGFIRERFY